jgi:ribosome maturation factor RimP
LTQAGWLGQVEQMAQELAGSLGLGVVEVEFVREGRRCILRVFLESERGITLDDCQKVSERFSARLDEIDIVPGNYYLEVSSPGLDRPLKKEADFVKFAGRRVHVKLFAPQMGRRQLEGELLGLVGGRVGVRLDNGSEEWLALDGIARARLVPEIDFGGR